MNTQGDLFRSFVRTRDTLRVYDANRLVFSSSAGRLVPLVEYLDNTPVSSGDLTIMDRLVGNAAALLCIKAGSHDVYSPIASNYAAQTLRQAGIQCHFTRVVPRIEAPSGKICPMEELSIGKTPSEFWNLMKGLS